MNNKRVTVCMLLFLLNVKTELKAAEEPMADFFLHSATSEKEFRLGDAKGRYVALHFLLKTECPFCLRHTQEYINRAGELSNVIQIFIKPDSKEEIRKWVNDLPENDRNLYPIYQDADAALAKKLNIPGGYKFHGEDVHFPALNSSPTSEYVRR